METKTPLVSIVMPLYNAESFVGEAVESVFSQSYENIQLIIVDDGSTDNSFEVASRLRGQYGDRLLLFRQENTGPYPARNYGIRQADGDIVGFLDADDYWDHGFIARMVKALYDSDADVAYCGWQNVGEAIKNSKPYIPPKYEAGDIYSFFLRSCPLPIHAALVRREILSVIGGFSERSFSSMDYDLWLRILAVTDKFILVPDILAYYRWHGEGQISHVKWKQSLNALQVKKDFIKDNPELISHIDARTLSSLLYGALITHGYEAYWKRDLESAFYLFRAVFFSRAWALKDLKYILPSLLPKMMFTFLVRLADQSRSLRR